MHMRVKADGTNETHKQKVHQAAEKLSDLQICTRFFWLFDDCSSPIDYHMDSICSKLFPLVSGTIALMVSNAATPTPAKAK
jgi:hypothetical protein